VPKIKDFEPKELGIPSVRHGEYQPRELGSGTAASYADVKKKFGPLAATDDENVGRSTKAASFKLNPDARRLLGVEDEEKSQYSEVVRQEVEKQISLLSEQAQKEGYESGYKSGSDEANAQVVANSHVHFERLNALFLSLDGVKDDMLRANEKILIDLIFQISKSILLRELKLDREYVVRLASSIIERLGVRDHVKIKVNKEDLQEVNILKERIQAKVGELRNLQILESDEVVLGGCKVESELAAVDATIETQLEAMQAALQGRDANS
jgi:flagellar assembly protein FliH